MNTQKEKDPLAEVFEDIIPQVKQYSNPTWRALWLAYTGNEIDLDSYLQFCNDFNFLPF